MRPRKGFAVPSARRSFIPVAASVGVQRRTCTRCALHSSCCHRRPENASLSRRRDRLASILFCTRLTTSFGRRAPTLLRGDTLTVDGPGRSRLLPRCARVPAPSTLFDCCVYFYTRALEIQPIQLDITPRHRGAILTFTPVNLLLRYCLPFGWRVPEEHQPTAIAIGRRDHL